MKLVAVQLDNIRTSSTIFMRTSSLGPIKRAWERMGFRVEELVWERIWDRVWTQLISGGRP